LGTLDVGRELHRADLAVKEELSCGGHGRADFRCRRVLEAGRKLELELENMSSGLCSSPQKLNHFRQRIV